jgi:histone-lysine N-methyltransferase SETMAR
MKGDCVGNLSKTTVYRIVHDTVGCQKVSARWVPKELTEHHKAQRMGVSLNNLLCYKEHPAFLDSFVAGDETWVHHITPETKRKSTMWKHPSSPTAKKFKVTTSVCKVMATVFWDMNGILLVDFIHKNETINADCYIQTLQKLRQAIRPKYVGMLTRGVKLFLDNATPHTAGKTRETIEKMGWEILENHPDSPDLARSDFHLFGKLKEHLSGKGFASDQEVENETRIWLTNLDANFYAAGILKLVSCWNKCLNLFGDYVEKYVKSKLHFGMCIQKIRIKFSFFFSSVP